VSFHSSLIGASVWPADLVTAGVVAVAAAVYDGRRPQKMQRQDVEVWVERQAASISGSGLHPVDVHPYLLRVRGRANNPGHDGTGRAAFTVVESHLQTIIRRYDGALLFASTFSGMLPCEASEESVDTDPADEETLEAVVRVTFRVRR